MTTKTVLIADDEPDIRALLRATLERAGFSVLEAGDGAQTVAMAVAERPDVITTDILEPRMTGLEALEQLKADPATESIPVVVVSCMDGGHYVERATQLGAASYLTKPFRLPEYVAHVDAAVRRA